MAIHITLPASRADLAPLRAGDAVLLSGSVLTARDAAHKRLCALLDAGQPLPVDLAGQGIYYTGPCPPMPGQVIGACGPTTSGRMDAYAPRLLQQGLLCMIGKGQRSPAVIEAMRACGAVYLAATGGAGALLAGCVRACRVLAFPELGTEAIHLLRVENFPLIVAIDSLGNDLYAIGPARYAGR
ncbi:MAG: FumA C-terminus/TtdB family hydratase beta subunit [Oscillospiraceae bacterium]|jgi:fumarate hydratase subunit beta|nr:FumA C-terminus/TtdB family hydratase beta subunit [Oscillospiraceae bacterium]